MFVHLQCKFQFGRYQFFLKCKSCIWSFVLGHLTVIWYLDLPKSVTIIRLPLIAMVGSMHQSLTWSWKALFVNPLCVLKHLHLDISKCVVPVTVNVFQWFVLLDSAHLHLSVNLGSTCLRMWIYIWHLWTVCSTYICFVVTVDYDVVVCVYVVCIWKMFMSSTVYIFVVQYSGGDGSLPCTWLMLWTCMSNNFISMIAFD